MAHLKWKIHSGNLSITLELHNKSDQPVDITSAMIIEAMTSLIDTVYVYDKTGEHVNKDIYLAAILAAAARQYRKDLPDAGDYSIYDVLRMMINYLHDTGRLTYEHERL